jgi:hypothetical protein
MPTELHRFTTRLLWRLAAIFTVLLVAARMLGATSVWQVVEWLPMTIAILLVVVHVASFIRQHV